MSEELVGTVTDYFARIGVAALDLDGPLRVGDDVHIVGHTTDLKQRIDSMQIEHEQVDEAKAGDAIAIKVAERCRKGDVVYRVT